MIVGNHTACCRKSARLGKDVQIDSSCHSLLTAECMLDLTFGTHSARQELLLLYAAFGHTPAYLHTKLLDSCLQALR